MCRLLSPLFIHLFNRRLENIFLKLWTQNQVEDILKFSQDQLETGILMMQKKILKLAHNPNAISAQRSQIHTYSRTLFLTYVQTQIELKNTYTC